MVLFEPCPVAPQRPAPRRISRPGGSGRMVDADATLSQNLFEITIGHGVPDVEEDCMQDHIPRELRAFERNHRLNLIDKMANSIHHLIESCDRTTDRRRGRISKRRSLRCNQSSSPCPVLVMRDANTRIRSGPRRRRRLTRLRNGPEDHERGGPAVAAASDKWRGRQRLLIAQKPPFP